MKPFGQRKPKSCMSCKFWDRHEVSRGVGYCNRYPPLPVKDNMGVIPMTHEDYWCGEYAPNAYLERRGIK